MDEELRAYLDSMTARMNDQHERLLNRLTGIERDFLLVGDALVSGRRWLDLEARVTKLEDGKP
jgi:hypothetical protein